MFWLGSDNMSSNPFTVIFGVEPKSMIPRDNEFMGVVSVFESDNPMTYGYVITGVRGCGKTVLMTALQNYFANKEDWYVLRLNPDMDLFSSAVSQLSQYIKLESEQVTEANLSIAGFGAGVSRKTFSDSETLLRKMLLEAKKKKKRVLVAIDEASNTRSIKTFAHSFQAFIGENLPLFLLMTALPENFTALSNAKNGTFLRRLPRIKLEELNSYLVVEKYKEIFKVSEDDAISLARIVQGYPYAFQLLGALLWDSGKTTVDDKMIVKLDGMLYEGAYSAIWNHLTDKEKNIVVGIAKSESGEVKDIRNTLGMAPNQFSPYRNKLIEYGLIKDNSYGTIEFTLPRFKKFILYMEKYNKL
ncbi:MAG: ATP-binding protein [Lachnospiraceae bacterium]|nr:ATP-binding protein [Lachnospiraceae bacterium]